jgi:alpha-ketoglutarate-dependent taurine dioxygenase
VQAGDLVEGDNTRDRVAASSSYDRRVASGSSLRVHGHDGEFGPAIIRGLIPAEMTDPDACRALRAALWSHAVACVRFDRPLDEADARALASMFGRIKDPVGRTRDGGQLRYSEERQIVDAGFVLTDELRAQLGELSFGGDVLRPGLFEAFHTDDTYTERPALATVLLARELPASGGGDTSFIDMRAAYQLLDQSMRTRLDGLRAVHTYNNHGVFPPRVPAEGAYEALVDVVHPIVRAHQFTGEPSLYFDLDRATHVEGLPEADGRALLQQLQDHAETAAPRYAHHWLPNDVVIWDNSAVQHKASGDFPVGEPRNFWRYMIEGLAPAAYTLSS